VLTEFLRKAAKVLATPVAWQPSPTNEQKAKPKRLANYSLVAGFVALGSGACLFFVPGWPEWLGYCSGVLGLISWLLFVRSKQELAPPGKGPFGGG
jgi:hypothetical protein